MLSCIRYQKRLGTYLDGELNFRQAQAIAAHVARCPACSEILEDIRRLTPVLQHMDVPPVPADLAARVMTSARVHADRSRRMTVRSPMNWWQIVSTPMRVATCVTILLAVFLGMIMGREISLSGSRPEAIAKMENLEGFEWFGQTPPASFESTYLLLASTSVDRGGDLAE